MRHMLEPEPGPLGFAGHRVARLPEPFEHRFARVARDARSIVGDQELRLLGVAERQSRL